VLGLPLSSANYARKRHSLRWSSYFCSCIICMLCIVCCPTHAISIVYNKTIKRLPSTYSLNSRRCIFCSNCTTVCPVLAISQVYSLDYSTSSKSMLCLTIVTLTKYTSVTTSVNYFQINLSQNHSHIQKQIIILLSAKLVLIFSIPA